MLTVAVALGAMAVGGVGAVVAIDQWTKRWLDKESN